MSVAKSKIYVAPDDGPHLPILDIVHKVTAEASGGSLLIEEWALPPGEMIPQHSYIVKPRGMPHAFYNAGAETVRVMEILAPGDGFEGYFDAYEEIVSQNIRGEEHRRARAELG